MAEHVSRRIFQRGLEWLKTARIGYHHIGHWDDLSYFIGDWRAKPKCGLRVLRAAAVFNIKLCCLANEMLRRRCY